MAANPATWMTDTWGTISSRSFQTICMPGSHDAGMSMFNFNTTLASVCNTRTQWGRVSDQLNAGSRYFDVRPFVCGELQDFCWPSGHKRAAMYTGHFTTMDVLGFEGAAGQCIESILSDVSDFMATGGSNEIVVLKFSHYIDYSDTTASTFSYNHMRQLVQQVQARLDPQLYTNSSNTVDLNTLTLSDIVSSGGRIIAVFDLLPQDLQDASAGIFCYADYPAPANWPYRNPLPPVSTTPPNLTVYDNYSDTDSLSFMEADQLGQFINFDPSSGALFLLSWTLTMIDTDYVASNRCIEDLAKVAHGALPFRIPLWQSAGYVSTTKIPNILYWDCVTTDVDVVDLCVEFNTLYGSGASSAAA